MAVRHDPLSRITNVNWGAGGFVVVGGGRNLQGNSLVFVRVVDGSPQLVNGTLVWSDGLFEAPTASTYGHDIPTPVVSIIVQVNYVDVFGSDPTDYGGVPGNSKEAWFSFAGDRLLSIPAAPAPQEPIGTTIYTDTDGSRVLITTSTLSKYDRNGVLIWRQPDSGGEAWSIDENTKDITVYLGGLNLLFNQDGEFLGSTSFDLAPGGSSSGLTYDVAKDGSTYSRFRIGATWQIAKFSRAGALQWQRDLDDFFFAIGQIAVVGDFVVVASTASELTPTREFHGSFGAGQLRHDHLKIYNADGTLVSDTLWGTSWVDGTSQAPKERAWINSIQRPRRVPVE